jgi:hypothetical protein
MKSMGTGLPNSMLAISNQLVVKQYSLWLHVKSHLTAGTH